MPRRRGQLVRTPIHLGAGRANPVTTLGPDLYTAVAGGFHPEDEPARLQSPHVVVSPTGQPAAVRMPQATPPPVAGPGQTVIAPTAQLGTVAPTSSVRTPAQIHHERQARLRQAALASLTVLKPPTEPTLIPESQQVKSLNFDLAPYLSQEVHPNLGPLGAEAVTQAEGRKLLGQLPERTPLSPHVVAPPSGQTPQQLLSHIAKVGTKAAPLVGPGVKDGGVFFTNPAATTDPKVAQHNNRIYSEVLNQGKFLQPSGLPTAASGPSKAQHQALVQQLVSAAQAYRQSKGLGPVPTSGQLTPQQIGTLLVEEGRKLHAHLTGPEVAEGIGVAEAETNGESSEQRQLAEFSDPEDAHIGLFAEEGNGVGGNVGERLNSRDAAHAALETFLGDDRSWNPAWVHWQEIQGENETGADRAPQYESLAAQLVHASGAGNPKAAEGLKEAKDLAREAGLDPKTILSQHSQLGPVDPQVVSRFHAALTAAKALAHGHIPYVYGGGHGGGFEESPTSLDCSGAVSWVLNKMGILKEPLVSGDMGQVLEPGPGAVTVYYNEGHTFMKIGKRFFGTSVDDSEKGLAFYGQPPESYLSTFSVGHVPGLGKKVALQLGIHPSELGATAGGGADGTTSDGIEYSGDGSTATIAPGAGKKKSSSGYSSEPILPEFSVSVAPSFAAQPIAPSFEGEGENEQLWRALLAAASGSRA